ncbi:DUF1648 domain-containing protein [Streptomyces sp. NPDC101227]|uniref:DUF1648 domain-containing protein n=1 Tax=Streptomyces sp. NPDC101227 TaxID=3366136 RepID=UPI0037F9EBE0
MADMKAGKTGEARGAGEESSGSPEPASGPLRSWLAAFPFIASLASVAGIYAAVSDRLPEPIATHFHGLDGRADGYSSTQGFLTGTLIATLVLGVGLGVLVRLRSTAPGIRWSISLGWGVATLLGALTSVTLLDNAGVTDAAEVRLRLWQVAAAVAAAVLCGALGWLLAGPDRRPPSPQAGGRAQRLALARGETAGWSRSISSPLLVITSVVLLAVSVAVAFTPGRLAAVVLFLSVPMVGALASVRVTVDRRGLALASTLVPYPFRRIRLDRVEEATSRRIVPLVDFGGWGYRVRPGRSGLVLRSGDGLVLRLTNGREFVVTVDDAATAAALVNTYLDRARERQGD